MIKSSDHNHRSIHTLYKLKRGPPKTIPHHLAALVCLVRFWGEPLSLESIYRLCILEWPHIETWGLNKDFKDINDNDNNDGDDDNNNNITDDNDNNKDDNDNKL